MKMTQTETTLEAKQSGANMIVTGMVFLVIGIIMAITMNGMPVTDGNGNPSPVPAWVFGAVVAAIGLIVVLAAKKTKLYLSKASESYIDVKRSLFPNKHQTFQLQNVTGVRFVATTSMSNSDTQSRTRATVTLLFNDGTYLEALESSGGFHVNIPLASLFRKAPLRDEATKIAQFIGVPLEAADLSSLSAAVNTVTNLFGKEQNSGPQQPITTPPIAPAPVVPQPVQSQAPMAPVQSLAAPVAPAVAPVPQPASQPAVSAVPAQEQNGPRPPSTPPTVGV